MGSVSKAIRLISSWDSSGGFCIQEAYNFFRVKGPKRQWVAVVWSSCITPKYAFILWVCAKSKLQTKDRLHYLDIDSMCPLCRAGEESVQHLFFQCTFSATVWGHIRAWLGISRAMSTIASALKWIKKEGWGTSWRSKMKRIALAYSVFQIWNAWNRMIF